MSRSPGNPAESAAADQGWPDVPAAWKDSSVRFGGSTAVRLEELGAVIFDMDGVVTDTASVHARAWKRLFDDYLRERSRRSGEPFRPFDIDRDYREHVDGKPRYDGVRDFLASRGIRIPEGTSGDTPEDETVRGLGNRKDRFFLEAVERHGVERYPGTIELIRSLGEAGVKVAIISASRNMDLILEAAGVSDLFPVRVDGLEAERLGLPGKPDPAVFLEAARRLGVKPTDTAILEDALAGVEAGRRGGFRLVIGVDRTGHAEELRARGADIVVRDPGELLPWDTRVAEDGTPFLAPTEDLAWRIEVWGYDPITERDVESWLTVANGRVGTRGSVEEPTEDALVAAYVAGVFGATGDDRVPVSGPSWVALRPRAGDEPLDLDRGETLEHRRALDLRQGIVFRAWRQRLPGGVETTFHSARFASLADRDVLVLHAALEAGRATARLGDGVPLPPEQSAVEEIRAVLRPGRGIFELQGHDGGSAAFAVTTEEADGLLTRFVGVGRSARGEAAPARDAGAALDRAQAAGLQRLVRAHRDAWERRWEDADIVLEGDPELQRAIRFALYHLISSADPDGDLASVGARGLSGPGYRGHVFWDTEIFVLPFYIHTHPASARALLAYRYRTLDAARARAAELGYRGALFAWESADTGVDVTPKKGILPNGEEVEILTGQQEHHIAADVAWGAWRYWEATADDEFLLDMGAEIVLETARFWASRARRRADGRFHIEKVIGPDEYHEGIDDNAFTNLMARWNLERACELPEILGRLDADRWRSLADRIGLAEQELREWREVAAGLVDGFDRATKLFEQFAGFFELEDVRAEDFGDRPFPGDVALGRERTQRSQMVKQADVLMLPLLLPELFGPEETAANYAYYEPRTSHGSSLSPAIYGAIAARVGRLKEAVEYVRMAATLDLANGMGNAAHGVHVATMGGLWQALVRGFGGFAPAGDGVRLDPVLPAGWNRLAFPIRWRGTRLHLSFTHDQLDLEIDGPVSVAVGTGAGDPRALEAGRYRAARRDGGWSPLERTS